LTTDDCQPIVDDNTFGDFWLFDVSVGQEMTIELFSNDFPPYLFLLDPADVKKEEASAAGSSATLSFTADVSGEWVIIANHFPETTGDAGNYTLSLQCSTLATPPAAPTNLTANAQGQSQIDLDWTDNATNENAYQVQLRMGSGAFQNLDDLPANTQAAEVTGLDADTPYTFRVRARNAEGFSAFSNQATARTDPEPVATVCVPSDTVVCLNGGRFQVEIEWRDFQDNTGIGNVAELPTGPGSVRIASDDSAVFYFFTPNNYEVLVKVLRGCGINNHYWVFAAATTNVEYTLRVTDTDNGATRTYFNPLGRQSPAITDTEAFATCP
jgi:hypothetical protein